MWNFISICTVCFTEIIFDPLKYIMDNSIIIVFTCVEKSIRIQRVDTRSFYLFYFQLVKVERRRKLLHGVQEPCRFPSTSYPPVPGSTYPSTTFRMTTSSTYKSRTLISRQESYRLTVPPMKSPKMLLSHLQCHSCMSSVSRGINPPHHRWHPSQLYQRHHRQ